MSENTFIDLDSGLVFCGTKSGNTVKAFATPSPYTPKLAPEHVFYKGDISQDIIPWFMSATFEPLYICGPTGTGKTSGLKQLATRLNYPVHEITGHCRLELSEMVGHLTVKDNNMQFEYGPLARAMRDGGIFLLNEIDLLDPSVAAGLNTILDGSPLCIAENGGEVIQPHPMFRFVGTANTNGTSDETGLYQGTLRMNLAFMDRFFVIQANYPPAEVEQNILSKFSKIPYEYREKMLLFAREVRQAFMGYSQNEGSTIEVTMSTRTLLRWATLAVRYQPLASHGEVPLLYALDRALGFRATPATQTALHEMYRRLFNVDMASASIESQEMPF